MAGGGDVRLYHAIPPAGRMALNRSEVGAHRTGVTGAHAAGAVPAATATALIPADVVERAAAGDRVALARLVAACHADLARVA